MINRVDKPLFWSMVGLSIFGLIMMSSMSVASSFDITGENDFYFWRHFRYIVLGIPFFILGLRFPVTKLRQLSTFIFLGSLILILLTFFVGKDYGTVARLWLRIGSFSLQPVEVLKLGFIIFLSALLASNKIKVSDIQNGFIPIAVTFAIPMVILMIQSDFGALLVISLIALSMYFCAGANLKHLFGGISFLSVAATIVVLTVPYIQRRVMVFLNPSLDTQSTGFQVKQALIAIGSGGFFGRGFQNSIQKFDYLPEVQSDTIFAAIAEEMGFFRILILIGIYLFIAWRGMKIVEKTQDTFLRLIALGITVWITGQAFINIGVNMALLPNTGITLPLISYGGTSMIMTFLAFGILLQISSLVTDNTRRRWR